MVPFPTGLPFASQTASFKSRMKVLTAGIVSRCHIAQHQIVSHFLKGICILYKRYEDLADSATH
jgi:hypothetical protein